MGLKFKLKDGGYRFGSKNFAMAILQTHFHLLIVLKNGFKMDAPIKGRINKKKFGENTNDRNTHS